MIYRMLQSGNVGGFQLRLLGKAVAAIAYICLQKTAKNPLLFLSAPSRHNGRGLAVWGQALGPVSLALVLAAAGFWRDALAPLGLQDVCPWRDSFLKFGGCQPH
jgi:hypothetical protein